MADEFKWIANDIDISGFYDKLGSGVKELIAEAEQADKNNCNPAYCEICDSIEVQSKLLVPDIISHKEWDLLCEKYYPR